MTRRKRAALTTLAVAAVALLGCGGDHAETTDAANTASTRSGSDTPDLLGPGTEIAEGLVVPDGASLAGATVHWRGRYSYGGEPRIDEDESWAALLVIEDDPFAVFDHLATQVRDLGREMPGTADSCLWTAPGGDDHLDVQREPVAWGEPSFDVQGLICEASASDTEGSVHLDLTWGSEAPGVVLVSGGASQGNGGYGIANWPPESEVRESGSAGSEAGVPEPGDCDLRADTAPCEPSGTTTPTTAQPRDTLPPLTDDPVPDTARDRLPERTTVDVDPGQPFGGIGNCFSEGYRQFVLPDGASLVATQGGSDGASVLAVDDLSRVIDALAVQADPTGMDVVGDASGPLLDGTEVVRTDISISGGGGYCSLTGSTDGRFLMVAMSSD